MPIGEGAGVSLGAAQGSIRIDTSDLSRVSATSQKVGADVERNLGRMGAGAAKAEKSFQGLSRSVVNFAGALGVSFGAAAALRLIQSSSKAASDLTESINKTGVAFSTSGDDILDWSENSVAALGQSRQQALEAASSFGLLFTTMGLAPAESAAMSKALVQLAADMASINNISPEDALTKLRAGLVGEIEPLRTVGVLLNAAAVEAKAMELGLANSTKALTEQDKVMARYQLILEQTALTQGDFARTSDQLANRQRIAAAAAKDAQAAFGEVIQEDVLEATNMWTNALIKLTTWIKNARAAADGESLGTALLQMGGWKLPGQKEAEDSAKEVEVLTGFLGKAQEGLVSLQAQFEQGLVEESEIERQIALIHEFEQAIIAAKNAGGAARVTLTSKLMGGVGNYQSIAPTPRFAGTEGAAQLDLIRDRFTGLADIERDANDARLDATRQYEEQRTSTIRDYGKTIARDADDFGRARVRAEQEFAASIADVRQDAARREAQQAEDMARVRSQARSDADERIAEARADANERLAELDEDYQKARVRAAGDHRETLLGAAARLDAAAVVAEQRRFARESKDAEDAHKEQRRDVSKQLQERIADEEKALEKSNRQRQEAYDRQLEDARAADAERIADMQEDFAQRKAQEDEDRALRLARMAEDHQDQVAEMDRQHALDLQQIATQEAESRAKVQEEFEAALAALGLQTDQWIAANKRVTDAAIKDFDLWWKHVNDAFALAEGTRKSLVSPRGYADGGPVNRTGTVLAHAGEYVLNAPTTRALSSMMGGLDQTRLLSAVRGGGGRNITVAPGAVQITMTGNQAQDDQRFLNLMLAALQAAN